MSTHRLGMIQRHLSNGAQICIGNICLPIPKPSAPDQIPCNLFPSIYDNQELLNHLRWMMQKTLMNQDMFLYGPPGPFKRRLAISYLSLIRQEYEYVHVNPDTSSESDLKQRREIAVNSQGGQELKWVDGVCVRAALLGRCLIIEGIEKADRNVLPVINNLLENREITLEDGRHIISNKKYDSLLKAHTEEELTSWGLLRAHERFRVIALGIPVPPWQGMPLDPPFRSRFQVRYVDVPQNPPLTLMQEQYFPELINHNDEYMLNMNKVLNSIRLAYKMGNNDSLATVNLLPSVDQSAAEQLRIFNYNFPLDREHCPFGFIERYWPGRWLGKKLGDSQREILDDLLRQFNIPSLGPTPSHNEFRPRTSYNYVTCSYENEIAKITFQDSLGAFVEQQAQKGTATPITKTNFISTARCQEILTRMMQAHVCNSDIILVGPKSSSKSILVTEFARILNYEILTVHCYRDMTARDFLQRRSTRLDGSTFWQDSPLVTAAKSGYLAVLEGLHWIPSAVLGALARLFQDREIVLPDGSKLVNHLVLQNIKSSTGYSDLQLEDRGIFRIHPAFRIIGTAVETSKQESKSNIWHGEEIYGMAQLIPLDAMSPQEERTLLKQLSNSPNDIVSKVLEFSDRFQKLGQTKGHENILAKSVSISTRLLIRICKRAAYPSSNLYTVIYNACLGPFMPHLVRQQLVDLLSDMGIQKSTPEPTKITSARDHVIFGDVKLQKFVPDEGDVESVTLIPHTDSTRGSADRESSFFENQGHNRVMRDLALDFLLGEHLLVIGNQGVGKNKLTDRFLELLEYPREYIQLHRDTTVQSLLVQPIVENGRIVYKDSPLLKAVKKGRVLIVDECDKAPVYITSILKSLAETGEMEITSGSKIRKTCAIPIGDDIPLHPNFRIIVLANRPGFPFLGNDFYGAIGDVFGTFTMENPDFESEVTLLKEMAPKVPEELIKRLVGAFGDLRKAFDDGLVSYPYSLRELINIVLHLQKYPNEPVEAILRNVFDFDVHKQDILPFLTKAFQKHGITLSNMNIATLTDYSNDLQITYSTKAPAGVGGPKEGKIDENNEPHVGGNTWQGGTGGSDTAGLGGRGGPFRVDSGHQIHQLSDAEKSQVSPEVLKAARAMGTNALKKRLVEIQMSSEFAKTYQALSEAIEPQVQQLKIILEGVQGKEKEKKWLRNQRDGEIDDGKLVEGIAGEQSIYKKRGKEESNLNYHELPKRIKFLFDVSGSMFRFNTYDYRLNKSLETALMLMKSLDGMDSKYLYDIIGHSGDSPNIEFVKAGKPPKNEKEMMRVLDQMVAHSQYCWTGDNTLEATKLAIKEIVKENCDDYLVVVISDANLSRYGIEPSTFGAILDSDPKVSAIALFIGSLGQEANMITKQLPSGKAFVVSQTRHIPQYMQEIFSSIVS